MAERPLEPAIWTEPVRGSFPDPGLLGLSGLDQLLAYLDAKAPAPPLTHLTGMRPRAVAPGASMFTMPATPWLLPPPGYLSLGALAILADGPLGSAIQTALPPGRPYVTSDLSLSFLRPVDADGSIMTARGRLIHAGRSLGLSDVVIEDAAGRPVAHGTSRCFLLPPVDPPRPPEELPDLPAPSHDTPDPFLRPVAGRPLPQEVWDRLTGLEVMRGLIAGDLPAPPMSHLTGLGPVEAAEGACTFAMPASGWLCSPAATVEGGAIALLAETAMAAAVQTTVPARTAYTPLDLKVNYLRPVFPDGRDLTGRGTVVHRGRTLAVTTAEVANADGKRVALATGTTYVREGRPWRPEVSGPNQEQPG